MYKAKRKLTAGIAAAAILGLAATGLAAQSNQESPRTLSISGSAKVSVDIDYLELSFSAITRDKNFEKAQTDNIKVVDKIIKDVGSAFKIKPEDMYTDDYKLYEYYDENASRNGDRVRAGYESRTDLRIKLRDLTRYKDMLIALLKAGVNNINSINYVPKELGPYKAKALSLAFQAAKAKADELAKSSGVTIKRVLSLTENSAVYNSGPTYRGNYAQTNAMAFAGDSGGSGDGISVGDRTLSAEVAVIFEIE